MNEVTLKIWVVCTLLLTVKMWVNSMVQAHARFKYKTFVIPEDARCFSALLKTEMTLAASEHPLAQRAAACWRNDLENIPLFMIVTLGYTLIGGAPEWMLVYGAVFFFARALHTLFYLTMLQPWRTVVYELGALVMMVLTGHTFYLALG